MMDEKEAPVARSSSLIVHLSSLITGVQNNFSGGA
jgi:hypothetical protein